MLAVVSRSSTPKRKGLLSPHGFGVIDTDYCGESDEIGVLVYNFTDRDVEVLRGERIAQGVFIKVETAEFIQKSKMAEKSRGGFGSTGKV
jgi:dUTP pyrophosphatase